MSRWKVLRHGGRRSDVERVLYAGEDEEEARGVFAYWAEKLRQGSVRLTDSQMGGERDALDHTVEFCTGPRLRTRW